MKKLYFRREKQRYLLRDDKLYELKKNLALQLAGLRVQK